MSSFGLNEKKTVSRNLVSLLINSVVGCVRSRGRLFAVKSLMENENGNKWDYIRLKNETKSPPALLHNQL